MNLTILAIVLWPKNQDNSPRVISLEPGKINIISGQSATGKSSLGSIIDYALGSDKCTIPVGLIRDVTAWFGLHLRLQNTEMVVARRNPEDQQSTNELYWNESANVSIPPIILRSNGRVEDLKARFNQMALLPSLPVSPEESIGFGGRPSFRDMAAFTFQPQHIVANPYTLFFKADTTDHREKLKNIFPLVLGAITADSLAKQRELRDVERELDRLRREYDARRNAVRAWEGEIESYYLQALSLGLLQPTPLEDRATWNVSKYADALRPLPADIREMDLPDVALGTSDASAIELSRLVSEEDDLGQQISVARRRLDKLVQLSDSFGSYSDVIHRQEDRLSGIGWFAKAIGGPHECPVCHAKHDDESPQLKSVAALALQLGELSTSVQVAPAALDEELSATREDLRDMEGRITKLRRKRRDIESQSEQLATQRQHTRQIFLFVGRVQEALKNVDSASTDGSLVEKGKRLADRAKELKSDLDPQAVRRRQDAALEKISRLIANYAEDLKLEHARENVSLNVRDLTLQFKPASGRTDYLWEVGSGQNWVGYHIATMIALHLFFQDISSSPVPTFLVIDQPSQVYFPEAWPTLDEQPEKQSEGATKDADIAGVHRIFKALSRFISEAKGQFQVLVTEHAGQITWSGLEHVHFVGNWRSGHDEFLIPEHWKQ